MTGAAGFTGQYFILHAQSSGLDCIAVTQEKEKETAATLGTYQLDITDYAAVENLLTTLRPDYIVHLAAISFVGHGRPAAFYQTNLIGTLNLVTAVQENSIEIENFLMASSGNVYGNTAKLPISEAITPTPANDYGVSKHAMEQAALLRQNQLSITIVRPFNYTGVGQREHFLIPKIVSHFRERAPLIELGNLDVSRDFSDVRDVVSAYVKLLTAEEPGGVYNVCSGSSTSLEWIIEMLEEITGHSLDVRVNPSFVRSDEIKVLYGDSSKLDAKIGSYRNHDIKSTLKWMVTDGQA